MKKRILSSFLAVCIMLALLGTAGAVESNKCGDNLTWELTENNSKLIISGSGAMFNYSSDTDNLPWRDYRSSIQTVELPEGLTIIASVSFLRLENLTDIHIPDTVTILGAHIFERCTKLETVNIPDSVTTIPSDAFSHCISLKSITLPSSIDEILGFAFSDCSSLTSISIPNSVKCIRLGTFSDCSSLENVVIPDSVTEIESAAFTGCTSLEAITFPNSITELGNSMFGDCTALKSFSFPNLINEIGFGFFQNCTSLSKVDIPISVTDIDSFAFLRCSNFADIYYAGTKTQWGNIVINDTHGEYPNQLVLSQTVTVHCSDGEIILDKVEFNPHTHQYRTIKTLPTCTEQGYTTYRCECGDEYVDDHTPARGHAYGRWEVVQEAAKDHPGLQKRSCINCEHEESETIPWIADVEHTHTHVSTVTPPTCTSSGYTIYTCTCGDTYQGDETPATGHSYGPWEIIQEATESCKGLRKRSCSTCGSEESETIPVLTSTPSENPNPPVQPDIPNPPTDPTDPTYPGTPGTPSKPSESEESKTPEKEDKPEQTTMPEQPAEPEVPVQPERPETPVPVYSDVPANEWYGEAVSYVAAHGLMTGTTPTTFSPAAPMTRAMAWTLLGRLAGADVDGGTPWYAKAQTWAISSNISDGSEPDGNITREQLVTMLYRQTGSPAAAADLAGFADSAEVSDWAIAAVQWAVANGLLKGDNGRLNPTAPASRAEVAALLMRFCEGTAK